jgi:ABC-type nitrate/sulfonate/bicarbonate transport system substrate-binding protein
MRVRDFMRVSRSGSSWRRVLAAVSLAALAGVAQPAWAQKITVATGADPNFGIFYVASDKGIFKKHGLEVELKTGASGSAQVPLIISGDVQLAFGSGGACIRNHILKPDKVALFGEGSVLNEYDGVVSTADIPNLAGLKGKKVGLAVGTGSEVFFTTLIARNNMKKEDFEIIPVDAPEMIPALQRKDIAAYAAWEPWVSRGVRAVKDTKVLVTSKGIWSPSSFLCGDKEWARKNPAQAANLMKALAETADWINANRAEAAKSISQVLKLDLDLTTELVKKCEFRAHFEASSIAAIVDDYENLVSRNFAPANPTKAWWQGFIYDAALKAGAPKNVNFAHPGS